MIRFRVDEFFVATEGFDTVFPAIDATEVAIPHCVKFRQHVYELSTVPCVLVDQLHSFFPCLHSQ